MMTDSMVDTDSIIESIRELVFVESKVVTTGYVSKEFGTHPTEARNIVSKLIELLKEEGRKEDVICSYIITGYAKNVEENDELKIFKVLEVDEDEVEECKNSFFSHVEDLVIKSIREKGVSNKERSSYAVSEKSSSIRDLSDLDSVQRSCSVVDPNIKIRECRFVRLVKEIDSDSHPSQESVQSEIDTKKIKKESEKEDMKQNGSKSRPKKGEDRKGKKDSQKEENKKPNHFSKSLPDESTIDSDQELSHDSVKSEESIPLLAQVSLNSPVKKETKKKASSKKVHVVEDEQDSDQEEVVVKKRKRIVIFSESEDDEEKEEKTSKKSDLKENKKGKKNKATDENEKSEEEKSSKANGKVKSTGPYDPHSVVEEEIIEEDEDGFTVTRKVKRSKKDNDVVQIEDGDPEELLDNKVDKKKEEKKKEVKNEKSGVKETKSKSSKEGSTAASKVKASAPGTRKITDFFKMK